MASIILTASQDKILKQLIEFANGDTSERVFILKGYAGTGKTTLMGFLIKHLEEKKRATC